MGWLDYVRLTGVGWTNMFFLGRGGGGETAGDHVRGDRRILLRHMKNQEDLK